MCEKTCKCESCIRKWRGCRCARREIPCLPGQCECRKWNRECDADLCRTCGAAETLDPVNRYNLELAKSCCGNVEAQRGLAKRTFIGLSNIAAAGLGLFIGEDAKKDSFIGEYLGEIISEPEAERRGVLYDKRGVSFLFNLNKEQVVDAARAGNKLRFINHYHEPNCIARVVMTGVIHRIGLYALRDLYQGEELFFDYGYNEMTSNFVRAEPEFMFEPPSTVEKPKKNTKTTLGRPGKRKGLKGKKLGKKRLRAATKQSLTAGSLLPQKRPRGRPRKHFPVDVTSQPSSRTSSRIGRLDMATPSSYSDDEDDDDSDTSETSEGSVIMIRNPGQPDADSESEEEEEEEEDVHKKPKPRSRLAIPDSADEDEDYEDDDEEGSRSSKGAEMTPASDEDGPELLHGQRKRRRMYSPMSRSRR
ncbi:SET domain-containing protein [Ascobolus immersus RN42]|uniref:SET domain-containing protein n=1 Tax=Ascobolus immersus RN42 TaxID=1160509 RepID=A0A3N4IBI3_ASCIM|nr:SET domain-containing protein [Ascobolus immersus RN42]